MLCSETESPWRKLKNISTVDKGEIKNVVQETEEGKQFSLSAQEALHQAPEYLGGLSMEGVPLGCTLLAQKNRPEKYANRVSFHVLAYATSNRDPNENRR